MKTQMVKNAIIVPVGSKGGFVLKGDVPRAPGPRRLPRSTATASSSPASSTSPTTSWTARSLHPPEVVRHDGDDPYLVVAADKGTAHLLRHRQQRLRRSTASGWATPSPRRQRRLRPQEGRASRPRRAGVRAAPLPQPGPRRQSAARSRWSGIGDMAGRRLRQRRAAEPATTRLRGRLQPRAHLHRPGARSRARASPSASASSSCRARPGADYDAELISKGGGIFDRSAKSIPSARRCATLLEHRGRQRRRRGGGPPHPPRRVDLLYNGGHRHLRRRPRASRGRRGGRSRQRPRPRGRCRDWRRARGGGGRQPRPRPSAAGLSTGRAAADNTDAVDNSGGVDMSDHEVNIKILIGPCSSSAASCAGARAQPASCSEMTEEVAELVLADNRNQARALTLDGLRSRPRLSRSSSPLPRRTWSGLACSDRADRRHPDQ